MVPMINYIILGIYYILHSFIQWGKMFIILIISSFLLNC